MLKLLATSKLVTAAKFAIKTTALHLRSYQPYHNQQNMARVTTLTFLALCIHLTKARNLSFALLMLSPSTSNLSPYWIKRPLPSQKQSLTNGFVALGPHSTWWPIKELNFVQNCQQNVLNTSVRRTSKRCHTIQQNYSKIFGIILCRLYVRLGTLFGPSHVFLEHIFPSLS